ncbi:MAG: GGDEF domain-containing protein [Rhodoferax sp.]
MRLDPDTLLIVNVANLLVLASTLPVIMGQQLSPAARAARRSLIFQGLGWVALILSGLWPETWLDQLLSTISMVCISASHWLLFQAFQGWLGPRPLEKPLTVILILMPVGYALTFASYPVRVGWSNLLIALQLLVLARAALRPVSTLGGRWRWVMFGCLALMAVLTAGRGIMGAFFTELYPNFTAPHPFNLAALLTANITLVLANVSILVAWREEAERELQEQANIDPLTTVFNRKGWNLAASNVFTHAQRHGLPLALLTIDLDHFKQINDLHGHEGGDRALRLFGRLLQRGLRSGDVIARIGGEEFCVLLAQGGADAARGFDQRLRVSLSDEAPRELGYALNFSGGLACLGAGDDLLGTLMRRSDEALYRAKAQGRARLVDATDPG